MSNHLIEVNVYKIYNPGEMKSGHWMASVSPLTMANLWQSSDIPAPVSPLS